MHTATTTSRPTPTRKEIVERAEQLLRDRAAEPLPISHLSLLVGVSERGLRIAFNAVRGMSPKQFVINDRLHEVRRALSDPRASRATVTEHCDRARLFRAGPVCGALQGRVRRNTI